MDALNKLETMLKNDVSTTEYNAFLDENFYLNKLYNLLSCFQIHLLTYCCEYKESVTYPACDSRFIDFQTFLFSFCDFIAANQK